MIINEALQIKLGKDFRMLPEGRNFHCFLKLRGPWLMRIKGLEHYVISCLGYESTLIKDKSRADLLLGFCLAPRLWTAQLFNLRMRELCWLP